MITGIDRVLLRVESLPAAVRYYQETMGLHLIRQEKTLAAFALGTAELILHNSPDWPAQEVYYKVDDLAAMYAARAALRLTFLSVPRPTTRGKTAVVRDPYGNVLQLLDRSGAVSEGAAGAIENAAPAGTGSLFAGVVPRIPPKRRELAAAYELVGRTADDLPYTHHFATLYAAYVASFAEPKPSTEEVWRHLLNARKAGKLPKLGDARSQPPEVTAEQQEILVKMLGAEIGKRDRLPYTAKFEALIEGFNRKAGLRLTPHQVWRLVAVLAK